MCFSQLLALKISSGFKEMYKVTKNFIPLDFYRPTREKNHTALYFFRFGINIWLWAILFLNMPKQNWKAKSF